MATTKKALSKRTIGRIVVPQVTTAGSNIKSYSTSRFKQNSAH